MKQQKKPAPNKCRIDVSVGKFRWISYKGRRITYDLIIGQLGGRENLIQFLRDYSPSFHSPPGLYGGNIPTVAQMSEPLRLLTLMGLSPQLLKKEIRFFVTIGASAAPDKNPNPRTHEIKWNQCEGYLDRQSANAAARSRFAYYDAWCRDEKNKPTNQVTLKIHDKDGKLLEEKTN